MDENRSLRDGGVLIWQHDFVIDYQTAILKEAAAHYGLAFDEHAPIKEYVGALRDLLLYGVESEEFKRHFPEVKPPKTVRKGNFEGVITGIWRRYREKGEESSEAALFESKTCPDCRGTRLKKESRLVTVGGLSIDQVASRSVADARNWARAVLEQLPRKQRHLTESVLQEIIVRMERLAEVGLGYLSLDRPADPLRRGDAAAGFRSRLGIDRCGLCAGRADRGSSPPGYAGAHRGVEAAEGRGKHAFGDRTR